MALYNPMPPACRAGAQLQLGDSPLLEEPETRGLLQNEKEIRGVELAGCTFALTDGRSGRGPTLAEVRATARNSAAVLETFWGRHVGFIRARSRTRSGGQVHVVSA